MAAFYVQIKFYSSFYEAILVETETNREEQQWVLGFDRCHSKFLLTANNYKHALSGPNLPVG